MTEKRIADYEKEVKEEDVYSDDEGLFEPTEEELRERDAELEAEESSD